MKITEKHIAQKLVKRVQSGSFDDIDVRSLFMNLRGYSTNFLIFREIADFVGHNDLRDRGVINRSLEAMYLRMKYFLVYQGDNEKTLNISEPFPLWIKKLMIYQVDKSDKNDLRLKYNVGKKKLKLRIRNGFKEDLTNNTAQMLPNKLSIVTIKAIQHIMSYLIVQPSFSQDEIINQLLNVIEKNKIVVDRDLFLSQSDRITLCILLLLNKATFDHEGHRFGYTSIAPEKASISHGQKFIDADGNEVKHIESFGKLRVLGHVVLDNKGRDITISHSVFETNLDVIDWCEDELFTIEPLHEKTPNYLCKKVKLDGDFTISEAFKLESIIV